MNGVQKMKLKSCPVCDCWLNELEDEAWCSNPECDYEYYIKQYPTNKGEEYSYGACLFCVR
jgi:hypothetical protein